GMKCPLPFSSPSPMLPARIAAAADRPANCRKSLRVVIFEVQTLQSRRVFKGLNKFRWSAHNINCDLSRSQLWVKGRQSSDARCLDRANPYATETADQGKIVASY